MTFWRACNLLGKLDGKFQRELVFWLDRNLSENLAFWRACTFLGGPFSRSEFESLRMDGVLHNWEASLFCGIKKVVSWVPCTGGMLKFVDGAARWKLVGRHWKGAS